MRKYLCLYLIVFIALSAGCKSINSDVKSLQKTLNSEEAKAMEATYNISRLLEHGALDSLYMFAGSQPNTLFYIFADNRLLFWSSNWLSANISNMNGYDKWYYQRFDNAHTICRWTNSGIYTILTVIPIKYAYPFQNQWLQNSFTSPFSVKNDVDVIPFLDDEKLAVYTTTGDYLFSLKHRDDDKSKAKMPNAVPSFSYQDLFDNGNSVKHKPTTRWWIKAITIVCIVLFLGMLTWAVWQIIRHKGLRNLPLRYKILFWFSILLFASFLYVGSASSSLIRSRYVAGQRLMLRDKCAYLQVAMKSRVVYMTLLNVSQSRELGLELKELASAYQTDINVYDLSGNLVATSFPEIFDNYLRSRQMAPEPMFRIGQQAHRQQLSQEPLIQYEKIGSMRYLAGYIECLNWDDIPIGYIGVPFYISENEMQASLDSVMAKIMPAYLVVMLLFIALSVFISRALTYPITELGKRLRNLDPTKKNEKLEYNSKDEIGDLVESYNKMVDDLNRNIMSLTEKEREKAWQTMARQVAHEIKNPLTPMKLTVQQMQRAKTIGGEKFDNYFDKATGMLIEQIDDLSNIAGSFSAFAKNLPDEINLDKVDVAAKLNMAVMMYTNYDNLSVRYIGPESGVMVYADVEQIGRVFTNILQNAVQAMSAQDDVVAANNDIIVMLKPSQEWVEISISDNGPGIPEDLRDKIFLPNFTTKTTGMGLGLAMCKNIVGRSGGELWYTSTLGKGTTFYIKLRMA